MDQGLGDEVAQLDVPEGGHLRNKENEYPLKPPESSNLLDYAGGSFHVIGDILDAKDIIGNVNSVDASEHLHSGPHFMDNFGNIVEELTVQNYDSSNLPVVGTSNNRERLQTRESQWQHVYQPGGASGIGSSYNATFNRDNNDHGISNVRENLNGSPSSQFLGHKVAACNNRNKAIEQSMEAENKTVSPSMFPHSGIRTKVLSKSGFAEFFVKNTLSGKGITFRGPPHEAAKTIPKNDNTGKAACVSLAASNSSPSAKVGVPSLNIPGLKLTGSNHEGINLRQWLNGRKRKMTKVESLYIFRQIVNLVDYSHSQEVILCDLRPSCFRLLRSNQVRYMGSTVHRDMDQDKSHLDNNMVRKRPTEQSTFQFVASSYAKKQKLSENRQWPQFTGKYSVKCETGNDGDINLAGTLDSVNKFTEVEDYSNEEYGNGIQGKSSRQMSKTAQQQLTSVNVRLEDKWYASPEELNDGICTISSNIYSLGVLLFELLGHFDAGRGHDMAMSDLRHRILPAQFLSESPKEAGFCLWLLHPVPSSRPTTREILQCEVLSGLQKVSTEELSSSIDHDDAEAELLFHFLVTLNDHKQKSAAKLESDIRGIEADIEEVQKRYSSKSTSETQLSQISNSKDGRLKSSFSQLESAYYSMRSKILQPEMNAAQFQDKDLLRGRDNYHNYNPGLVGEGKQNPTDCLGSFFEGLCKYARYSKFEVRGLLRTGDFNSSANVICSLSFNRDMDYFSTAGVSKKVKIFEFNPLLDDSFDIHHPVVELPNKSKLSCVCWNSYIKNYLASTDYDGVVKLWDANTGQDVFQYSEHERRAWSVDFSRVYPTKLASGSDDCSVKLWSINEKKSLGTIRNIANVCCVQFSSYSTHLLAFGSADYKTYCYDMRNVRAPWCVLAGHDKAVSYVKFLDPETLVTASTDNSLRLWDLTKASSSGLSTNACSLTLSGHTNEKNFVGLSVNDGYIACGSETNEVYAYHRSLPMPITSHKFGSIDPISGKQTDDDGGQFVSSVCWRGNSDMLLAANSTGCIKVLQMV